jgi:hypothetical protein
MKTKQGLIGLLTLLLSGGLSIFLGLGISRSIPGGTVDFQVVYYATRCLMNHHDPYKLSDLKAVYVEEARHVPAGDIDRPEAVTWFIYLPTLFPVIAPFALLDWSLAHWLWILIIIGGLYSGAILMWCVAARWAPGVALALTSLLLANSEVLIGGGNAAGLAVSLCVFAAWCFLKEKYGIAGAICLALSLLIKPHDGGLVWLYFVLAGGSCRRRALQALAIAAILGAGALAWVSQVSPRWRPEWHANVEAITASGNTSDPGAISEKDRRVAGTVIDLQAVVAIFWRDARIYDSASYAVCGSLLLLGALSTLRSRMTTQRLWLGLATIVPLTMLATYHRPYDARLMLLTIPACAMIAAQRGPLGRAAIVLTGCAIACTGDLTQAALDSLLNGLRADPTTMGGKITVLLFTRTGSMTLLAMSVFYLWLYLRSTDHGLQASALTQSPAS